MEEFYMIPNGTGNIDLSDTELSQVISQLENCSTELKDMCKKLNDECDILKDAWHGACAKAYEEVVNNLVTSVLIPMQKLCNSYPETLINSKNEMFAHDEQTANAIRSAYNAIY